MPLVPPELLRSLGELLELSLKRESSRHPSVMCVEMKGCTACVLCDARKIAADK